MRLTLSSCEVRSYMMADAESLAKHANDRSVWINLRDGFPHPYTVADAERCIDTATSADPETMFAVAVDGNAVGGIGFTLHSDVERVSAEIGYWLGAPFRGQGIMTEVLSAVTGYAIQQHRLTRVYAVPFATNPASCKVLEKAGYQLEGRMRRSAIKDGQVIDQFLYAFVVAPEA